MIYTHNFYTDGKTRIFSTNMLHVKMHEANPKPWPVQHEINIEIGVTFFVEFVPILCC